jgi:hypothetical protein
MSLHLTLRYFLIGAFVVSLANPALAAAHEDPPFAIPSRLGAITDYFPGKADKMGNSHRIIVLIQDLHANVGVQKNIAATLYRLQRENKQGGSLLVCVEGASGEGDVSLLRSLPGPIRHGFEAMLLHRAYLTGAELAATEASADWAQQQIVIWDRVKRWFFNASTPAPVSLSPIALWGVDDPELYRKNWRAAKTVDRDHYPALGYAHNLRDMLRGGASPDLKKELDLVVKLLLLRLQPEEYKEYLQKRSLVPKGPPQFESVVKAAETYYEAAEARSHAMSDNLMKRAKFVPGVTALITGGFHTQEIAADLNKRGISYMVFTPRVEVLDQDQAYRARLREEE